jgi:hypothetical protein
MSPRRKKPNPDDAATGGTNENDNAPPFLKFCRWAKPSIKDANNLPHYLIAAFTFSLAIFACYAWIESRRGSTALEGQLKAMQADQRPYIWVTNKLPTINLNIPQGETSGQVTIDWEITNYGRGVAYKARIAQFIKIGANNSYIVSYGASEQNPWGAEGILPPGKINFFTVVSKPGITQDEFVGAAKIDYAIGVLSKFEYFDIYGTKFTDVVCQEHLATGAITYRDPKKCEQ